MIKKALRFDKFTLVKEDRHLFLTEDISKTDKNLSPKKFELLLFLIEHRNSFVSKDEILNKVWSEEDTVEESNLTTNISELRNILDDKERKIIQNKHGLGYKFIAEVDEIELDTETNLVAETETETDSLPKTESEANSVPKPINQSETILGWWEKIKHNIAIIVIIFLMAVLVVFSLVIFLRPTATPTNVANTNIVSPPSHNANNVINTNISQIPNPTSKPAECLTIDKDSIKILRNISIVTVFGDAPPNSEVWLFVMSFANNNPDPTWWANSTTQSNGQWTFRSVRFGNPGDKGEFRLFVRAVTKMDGEIIKQKSKEQAKNERGLDEQDIPKAINGCESNTVSVSN